MTDKEEADDKDEKIVEMEDPEEKDEEEGKGSKMKCCIIILVIILILIIIAIILYFVLRKKDDSNEENQKAPEFVIDETWKESYNKAQEYVGKLNLTEKISLLYGTENYPSTKDYEERRKLCVGKLDPFKNEKIDFKGLCIQDGPAGVRFAKGTSISWQSPINTAATFNKDLMYQIGKAQGLENKLKGINAFLSPCVNLIRSPQAGRIWEGFGEDPYLSGVAAEQLIKGIQEEGVIATVKHFILNEQETYRHASSSEVSKQALMDVYVEPFYRAVKAGVGSVLVSYNGFNGTYCSESKFLLTDVLRGILKFQGYTVSDWWGIYSNNTQSFTSGLDMNMPGGKAYGAQNKGRNNSYWSNFEQLVKDKKLSESRIDEAATRILSTMYKFNQMEKYPEIDLYKETKTEENIKLQRQAATESQILLKNDGILPLKKSIKTIAVIGNDAFARDCINGDGDLQCKNKTNEVINGHIPLGYGSGTTDFNYTITPIEGILNIAKEKGISVISSGLLEYITEDRNGVIVNINAEEDYKKGRKAAKDADVAIVFVKAISGEGYGSVEGTIGDRLDLELLHHGKKLIEEVAKVNNNTIVVINAPGVVNMDWINKTKAIIFSGYPGSESGNAIADILFGNVCPSGHLPYVWGQTKDDYPGIINYLENITEVNKSGIKWRDVYRYRGVDSAGLQDKEKDHDPEKIIYKEGLYIGQRWFNKNKLNFTFPFGFGLSYTKFNYTDLDLRMDKLGLNATFKVENVGKVVGKAVPMLFLTFPKNIGDYPEYILKGFEKVEIKPGEKKSVSIFVDDHSLSYFNVKKNDYVRVNKDKIKVFIGENGDPAQALLTKEIDAAF